jgi:hypothetical protein
MSLLFLIVLVGGAFAIAVLASRAEQSRLPPGFDFKTRRPPS